jgi:thiamine pyrophosphate-dependent acetolactate synthase large subunit-like protein
MLVSEAVAATLAELADLDVVFGVVGSGNFHVTDALVARGARFVAARHECGAACMADAWARGTGRVGILTVHQGPGLTNALTGITEAAKSRTPLLVLAPDVAGAAVRSNFRIDVAALATSVGAVPDRLHSPATAAADTARAYQTARRERRTVVLAMPLDVQAAHCDPPVISPAAPLDPPAPAPAAAARLAAALGMAERPVFVAGRGARAARVGLEELADACGALLATSAVAKGLFHGSPWDIGVSGGFASPLAAELISGADMVVGWGCSLNMWTMRHGKLIGPGARVAQVDDDSSAIGAHRPVDLGVHGDVAETARVTLDHLSGSPRSGYRSADLRSRIAREVRWRDVPYTDEGTPRSGSQGSDGGRIDPRTLTIALDDLLPAERVVAIDSGNFMGYPSMFLSVPDEDGFCFTQAYQSVGLGLASAIGAALAQPARLPVAALGDGGALMGVSELETVVRLGLPMVVVVYDDEAYGAEVHHFGPEGFALDTVKFPPADIAAIGRGFGCTGVTVRGPDDLGPVRDWLAGPRDRPLVIDAKVASAHGSWWLEEAFRGH